MRFNDLSSIEPVYGVAHGHIELFSFHDLIRFLKISSFQYLPRTTEALLNIPSSSSSEQRTSKQVAFLGFSEINVSNTILGVFRLECPIALNLNEPPTEHRTPNCPVVGEF